MWRSLFLALGAFAVIAGVECLVCDKAILAAKGEPSLEGMINNPAGASDAVTRREIVPPEWAPWSLLSGGAVTMLYSFTLPKRAAG
ncbi:MAG: hypothetical protein JNG90_16900 [Planctomycetaceae bacterium]|nr:hypothetical protein [Planctomycetaceae bacterium]